MIVHTNSLVGRTSLAFDGGKVVDDRIQSAVPRGFNIVLQCIRKQGPRPRGLAFQKL